MQQKLGSNLNDSGDAASSELEARSEEFEDRSLGNRTGKIETALVNFKEHHE